MIDEDREICLSIEVPVKRFDEMLAQSDKFFDAIDTEAFVVEGGVDVAGSLEVLEGEELRYFNRMASSIYFGKTLDQFFEKAGEQVSGQTSACDHGAVGAGFCPGTRG